MACKELVGYQTSICSMMLTTCEGVMILVEVAQGADFAIIILVNLIDRTTMWSD